MGEGQGGRTVAPGKIDYDEVLKHTGQFGKFQIKIHFLLWLVSALSGLAVVVFAFTGYVPKYRCKIPHCDEGDSPAFYANLDDGTYPDYVIKAIPSEARETSSKCQLRMPLSMDGIKTCDQYTDALSQGNKTVSCGHSDLFFDQSVVLNSVVTDYQFTCGNYYLRDIYSALYMLGMLFGSMIFGLISDRFGRMPALMLAIGCICFSTLLGAFMPTAAGYGFFRWLTGIGGMGCFMITFVIAVEYVGFKYTMLLGILIEVPFALGELVLAIDAYLIRDWVTLQLVAYVPWIVLLVLWFLIPESPRWLIASGHHDKAVEVIEKMAKANGKTVPKELLNPPPEDDKMLMEASGTGAGGPEKKPTVLDLFKKRDMALRSLNMFFQWFSVTMCYYGLSFASTSLAGSPHTNFCLSVIVEIPGYLFCIFVMDCWGRRPILSFCQLLSGISCILAGVMFPYISYPEVKALQLFFSLLGKFMASACFAIVYVYTAELYPTIIRNTAIGSCSLVARIGGIIALLCQLLSTFWSGAPMVVLGIVALIAGALAIFFPETVGMRLPETMDEAVNIGERNKHRGLCSCSCPENPLQMFKDE